MEAADTVDVTREVADEIRRVRRYKYNSARGLDWPEEVDTEATTEGYHTTPVEGGDSGRDKRTPAMAPGTHNRLEVHDVKENTPLATRSFSSCPLKMPLRFCTRLSQKAADSRNC